MRGRAAQRPAPAGLLVRNRNRFRASGRAHAASVQVRARQYQAHELMNLQLMASWLMGSQPRGPQGESQANFRSSTTCCPSRQQAGQQTATHLALVADDRLTT